MRPILSSPFLNKVCAVLLSSACSVALAENPPARVGRISTVEGQVLVRAGDGEAQNALLNWPVTTDNRLTTQRGALAELRVGAAAVRLDGDSELEVSELDDDSFKLHLAYGTLSVRVRNPDALRGFELTTAQARVTLIQPGWVRIDAGRQPGTSVVSVLEGVADVDGATGSVTLRAGKRAELTDEQLRTGALHRIAFDNWPEAFPAAAPALRYVTDDTTGYEELDRYGVWQDNAEYGPLWLPSTVPAGWAPYSDGRWTWIAPWGWTWVDNAPWGYAPSHYGRWVLLGHRWGWAPGRERGRVPWAPALVGWVGGSRMVDVPRRNRSSMPPPVMQSLPLSTAPAPAGNWQRPVEAPRQQDGFRRDGVNRPGRLQTDDGQTHMAPRPMRPNRPPVPAQPQQPPVPPQPVMPAMPALPPVQDQVAHPAWRGEQRPRAERPLPRPVTERGNSPRERNNERGGPGRNGRMPEAER
ncbi:DUF6600 domain-containing protein [Janthinobacterium sp. LB3P112]|uniref:DUF6600 domain-containing protein n=1 Tax=Janthinobacterium sp. LB3P112 TaxID=3424196 RepID=UPI003F27A1FB